MSAPRHAIFISYRRRDSIYAVDRLDERLKHAFGAEAVFRDVRSIRKGYDFPADIRNALDVARLGLVGPSRNGGAGLRACLAAQAGTPAQPTQTLAKDRRS